MDLPFPVKRGEPITAENTNRTIGAVRWAVNKIESTFPKTRAGSTYTPPFKVSASKNSNGSYTVTINEGFWYGRGNRGTATGCMPAYELDDSGKLKTFFPTINGRQDTFWLPKCQWQFTPTAGDYYVFIGDPKSETGIVENHPAPYMTETADAVTEQAIATATCCSVVAIVRFTEGSNDTLTCHVIQMLANDFTYIAEYPEATHPFSFYRKSWSLNTFKCSAGLVHVRNPALWSRDLDIFQTESGGWTENYGGSIKNSKDNDYYDCFISVSSTSVSVNNDAVAQLISLLVTCELDGNTEGAGFNMGTKISTKWIVQDLESLVHDSEGITWTGYEKLLRVNYYIDGSEWIDAERSEFMVQSAGAEIAETWQVQIPVAIVSRYEYLGGERFFTCTQISQGVLEATPLMQYSFHKEETAETADGSQTETHTDNTDESLKSNGVIGDPVTKGGNATATRVDVARFKLEQEELDRANSISGEEIGTE